MNENQFPKHTQYNKKGYLKIIFKQNVMLETTNKTYRFCMITDNLFV